MNNRIEGIIYNQKKKPILIVYITKELMGNGVLEFKMTNLH